MRTWEEYFEAEEEAANQNAAEAEVARYFGRVFEEGTSPTKRKDLLDRDVYKGTDCGAWFDITRHAEIIFGSIVEGSDAEFQCKPIPTVDRTSQEIEEDIEEALAWLEAECEREWKCAEAQRELGRYYHDERI